MPGALRLLLCALALLWATPALADDRPPYLVYVDFGANPLAARARGFLGDQLNDFARWMDVPARVAGFPRFEVRPLPAQSVSLRDRRILAIIAGEFHGQEGNEPHASIDIGALPSLSMLENQASRFAPVRGIVRVGERGDLGSSMGMFETIIQYSLLVRAFEQRQPRLFGFVLAKLKSTIGIVRRRLGRYASLRCLGAIERNAMQMERQFTAPRATSAAPQKDFNC